MGDTEDTIVYRLGANCGLDEVEEGKSYLGRVQGGFAPFGVFVQLNDRVKGLVHKSNVKVQHTERDPIIVHVLQIRSNGNIDLEEVTPTVYQTQNVTKTTTTVLIADIGKKIGRTVLIEGEIAQIKQTSGGRRSSRSWTHQAPRTRPRSSRRASARIPRWNSGGISSPSRAR